MSHCWQLLLTVQLTTLLLTVANSAGVPLAGCLDGCPWYEVPSGATLPMHWLEHVACPSERLPSASSQAVQQPRPLSPAPEAADFESDDTFIIERARWFRDHGDGSELQGATRREQNDTFQRLKDRLFGLRRARVNPSGTPRAMQGLARGAELSKDPMQSAEAGGPPADAEQGQGTEIEDVWGAQDDY